MKNIASLEELNQAITREPAILIYFSHKGCGVCTVLKPKLEQRIAIQFPKIALCYIDVQKLPDVSAQFSIFAMPSVLFFFDGRKTLQYSRNMSVDAICKELDRPYNLRFNN